VPGVDPRVSAGEDFGAVAPWRAGGGGIVPGYRDGAPLAAREATGLSARPAGTPQSRAVTCTSQETLCRGERHLNLTPAAHRAVAAPPRHVVEHLLGTGRAAPG
jgi:hypothetical protein